MSSPFSCGHIVRTDDLIYPNLKGIKNAVIVSTCTFVMVKKNLKVYSCQKLNNCQFFHTQFVFFSCITTSTQHRYQTTFLQCKFHLWTKSECITFIRRIILSFKLIYLFSLKIMLINKFILLMIDR